MNKKLLTLAVGAALSAAPMLAQADTVLYGLLHLSIDAPDADGAGDDDTNLVSNASRLGVKGSEDLGNGLAAIYQYETRVNVSESGDIFDGTRNSFLGLKGGFGTVLFGRHDTPMKDVARAYDLFGDTVGDSRNMLQTPGAAYHFDQRWNSTVRYMTPKMGGFEVEGQYSFDRGSAAGASSNDDNDADGFSVNARYDAGMFDVMAAYEVANRAVAAPGDQDDTSAFRLAGGITLIDALRINALWQTVSDEGFNEGQDRDIWGIGAAYSMGNNRIKAQWYTADDSDAAGADDGADMWAIGWDHMLSKRTRAYVAYASTDNEDGSTRTPWGGGGHQLGVVAGAGSNPSIFSVGMVHKF